ncbi:ABC transporter substrate-binding protein [Pseudomonas daroniae]|uniref:ABC transporter substrate-binding protein n=1 Tax=Phytopseudomonas daroniae TaxID=2487519 RepID=A0A4Q9QF85_9GAMM|nr:MULTISPECIES: TRAP transporter substrate-binding protein DctP [Pseudomonas]TBU71429.1 ABC transporter substrate-binding protein [Pseudomonas daroniae]TBU72506.1 ABC transporter substrate-binding protein [Pseudomonas daroniae]TBU73864.1 ABC transporter substrate-binding protein [Pseudomonas sp. FRB 228]TBU86238.1 ABC transporter substrate-binding protein [Pseudomonas daroniae]
MNALFRSSATALLLASSTLSFADVTLRASHQFPGNSGDPRDEMVQIIAREVAAANVGMKIQIFPASSLYKANEQWGALTRGQLDMTALPLDYASGRVPQFSATLMPGLVHNYEHAQRLNESEFMKDIHALTEKNGAIVLADAWLAGGFASKETCITSPETIKGQVIRAAGPAFEQMLASAGASISSMPSSEIYTGMQTGVLDAANTSNDSFVSYRLYEQVKCLTAPGTNALWFMYEPVLISKKSFDRLNQAQKDALLAGASKAAAYFAEEGPKGEQRMSETFSKAGVKVVTLSKEDHDAWMEVARASSYKHFSEKVKGGKELLDKALAVQ